MYLPPDLVPPKAQSTQGNLNAGVDTGTDVQYPVPAIRGKDGIMEHNSDSVII